MINNNGVITEALPLPPSKPPKGFGYGISEDTVPGQQEVTFKTLFGWVNHHLLCILDHLFVHGNALQVWCNEFERTSDQCLAALIGIS